MCKAQWWALLGSGYIVVVGLLVYAVTTREPRVRTRDRHRGHHRR